MQASDLELPAGIYSDDPESYKPGREERRVAELLRLSSRRLSDSVVSQKKFKGVAMGVKIVKSLIDCGQVPVLKNLMSYLTWFDLGVVLCLLCSPWQEKQLALLAVAHVRTLVTVNSGFKKNASKLHRWLQCKKKLVTFFCPKLFIQIPLLSIAGFNLNLVAGYKEIFDNRGPSLWSRRLTILDNSLLQSYVTDILKNGPSPGLSCISENRYF